MWKDTLDSLLSAYLVVRVPIEYIMDLLPKEYRPNVEDLKVSIDNALVDVRDEVFLKLTDSRNVSEHLDEFCSERGITWDVYEDYYEFRYKMRPL